MKKIFVFVLLLCVMLTGCSKEESKKVIITTNFPTYDFVRAIVKGSDFEVKMLVSPGSETHDFEPTPKDIVEIGSSKLFFFVGGESDSWVDNVLDQVDLNRVKVLKMVDMVNKLDEEIVEGMEAEEEEKEVDEHVWTSPKNVMEITKKLEQEIVLIDEENKDLYEKNLNDYLVLLDSLDQEFRNIVKTAKRRELVFGDRFPFLYFVKEYGLTYHAAFLGCSDATEASAKTIQFLIDKVKEKEIPVVFHIELSNERIATEIARETGAMVLELHSAHNVSKDDFDAGITYVDIMEANLEKLKEALN